MKIELEIPDMLVPIVHEILITDVQDDDDGHSDINIMRHTGATTEEFVEAGRLVEAMIDKLYQASENVMVARTLAGKGKRRW